MVSDKLYDLWATRNPQWEVRYEESIVITFCDYGRGVTSRSDDRGKVFGAGYEIFIVAFFMGLYYDQKRPLIEDVQKRTTFGHPIRYWGNIESVKGRRTPYPELRKFIFTALIARTEIDFIALEKGELTPRKAVDLLMQTMEEYANWGFHFMQDKMTDDPGYFFQETAFLEEFLKLDDLTQGRADDEEPESLD